MTRILFLCLLGLAFAAPPANGQGSSLIWSSFSTGYQSAQGDSSVVEGMAGQVFVGNSGSGSSSLGEGFFLGYTTTSATLSISLPSGWNMVSVPLSASSYDKSVLYPSAAGSAFTYEGSYVVKTTLRTGSGYWIRFNSPANVVFDGFTLVTDSVAVTNGWNIIGSVSQSISVNGVTSVPPGMVTSPFFGYAASYQTSSTIEPGKAYWVKVNGDGVLVLSSSGPVAAPNRIRIRPTLERPPAPPLPGNGENAAPPVPKEFALLQNYPNPFNPVTHFSFRTANSGLVTLRVYDVLGREVATLVNETREPGEYRVEWDATSEPSGVYYCRMQAGSFVFTKTLVFLK